MSLSAQIAALATTPSPAKPGEEHLQLQRMEVAADALAQAAFNVNIVNGWVPALHTALMNYLHVRTNGGAAPTPKETK